MSSHSTYAMPVDKGDSSKESGQVEQLATIHEYIQEFDHNGTVPSKMLFSSYEFIFIFLPIVWFLSRLVSKQVNVGIGLLVLASFVFYAYWDPKYLVLLVFCDVVFN